MSQEEVKNKLKALTQGQKSDSVIDSMARTFRTLCDYADCPFLVKVSIPDLNIRKGAGTNTAKTGIYTGVGVFTILEVKEGKGSDTGWGRLKSGVGLISLDYCNRI